jgi:hypothetical protein
LLLEHRLQSDRELTLLLAEWLDHLATALEGEVSSGFHPSLSPLLVQPEGEQAKSGEPNECHETDERSGERPEHERQSNDPEGKDDRARQQLVGGAHVITRARSLLDDTR